MATVYFEIPLAPTAQKFFVTLAGVQYLMQLAYRTNDEGGWFLDIYDLQQSPLVQGVPLVTGVDLLAAYPELNFGCSLFVTTDGNPDAVPTYANLGSASHLYVGVPS